jgi:hypothetical protein
MSATAAAGMTAVQPAMSRWPAPIASSKACWLMPTSAVSAPSYRVNAQLELPGA